MYNFCCSETCSKHVTDNELIKRWTLRDNWFTNRYCQVIIRTKICKIPYSLTPYTIMNWYRCTSHTIANILFSQFLPICNIVLLQLSISVVFILLHFPTLLRFIFAFNSLNTILEIEFANDRENILILLYFFSPLNTLFLFPVRTLNNCVPACIIKTTIRNQTDSETLKNKG